jgi:hypothetical protein
MMNAFSNNTIWAQVLGKHPAAIPSIPKDNGQGIIDSGFQSREFGFGVQLNNNELLLANNYRMGKKYCNKKAARNIRGTEKKQALTRSPFVKQLEYGSNNEGYWNYDHMVVQMEDCIDMMTVLFLSYDYLLHVDMTRREKVALMWRTCQKVMEGNKV